MKFRVGQRVRALHDSVEGVIVELVDKRTVLVDPGDGFEIDYDINDIIPISVSEKQLQDDEAEDLLAEEEEQPQIMKMGRIFDISLLVAEAQAQSQEVELWLINPEQNTILYTCYAKVKSRYEALACGQIGVNQMREIARLSSTQYMHLRGLYLQLIVFKKGRGLPSAPIIRQINWMKEHPQAKTRVIEAIERAGAVFSLRENEEEERQLLQELQTEGLKKIQAERNEARQKVEVDLHIEEIVSDSEKYNAHTMLKVQLQTYEKAISDAIRYNYSSVVFIHGVGAGTLKREIIHQMKASPYIKEIRQADPLKYGNGATEAVFH